jgi:hypothetical protein
VKVCAKFSLIVVSLLTYAAGQQATPLLSLATAHPHFVCNTGYSLQACQQQVAILRSVLEKYPVHQQLGDWTWVLVRSQDWKPILRARGLDPDSPAFSFLEKRGTFIEEALLAEAVQRRVELLKKWQLPSDRLLELAVTHELGHALCNETDEAKADRYGEALRERRSAVCQVKRNK